MTKTASYRPRFTDKDQERFLQMNELENELHMRGYLQIAGVDEAGRGPLAGPVACAACILDPDQPIIGLNDSKKLSPAKRSYLLNEIKQKAIAYSVVLVPAAEIDRLNILEATRQGMITAIQKLSIQPDYLLTDAMNFSDNSLPAYQALIGGDAKVNCIAAASIIAKEIRDRYMTELDERFPGYKFSKHKGYGTREHYQAIDELGICEEHRLTFLKKLALSESNLKNVGSHAEDKVVEHLLSQGYEILARNYWIRPLGEIDIIAAKKGQLLAIEVKARSGSDYLEQAELSIDRKKRQRICRILNYYVASSAQKFKSIRTVLAACHLQTAYKIDKINFIEWLD